MGQTYYNFQSLYCVVGAYKPINEGIFAINSLVQSKVDRISSVKCSGIHYQNISGQILCLPQSKISKLPLIK
jgi:hypothetical protein